MTQRLYYGDSYTVAFDARIIERYTASGKHAVILNRTFFYPTGGGQPHDTGTINGIPVIDVFTRDEDHAVVHVLENEAGPDAATCSVNWTRRFQHMQHHTGQHILTQAFVQACGAHTVGFHLGTDSITIDLDTADLKQEDIVAAEDIANSKVFANLPVIPRIIDPGSADNVRIRKIPDHLHTDGLRVIDIEGFDLTACGGTHVSQTGEIGIIKVIKAERRGEETRIEFRCGHLALTDYRDKNNVVTGASAALTCGYWEIEQAIERLREEAKLARRQKKALSKQLASIETEHYLQTGKIINEVRLITAVFENRDVGELRLLVSNLVQNPTTIVLMGTSGEKAQVIMARSSDLPHDMNTPLRQALSTLGSNRGGGRPEFCQGGGMSASSDEIATALESAERALFQ